MKYYYPSIEECILDRDIENKIVKVHIMKGLLVNEFSRTYTISGND